MENIKASEGFETAIDQVAELFEEADAQVVGGVGAILQGLDGLLTEYLKQLDARRLKLTKRCNIDESTISILHSLGKKRSFPVMQASQTEGSSAVRSLNQHRYVALFCEAHIGAMQSSYKKELTKPNPFRVNYPHCLRWEMPIRMMNCFPQGDTELKHPITKCVFAGLYEITMNPAGSLNIIGKIGSEGQEKLEFMKPYGLAIHPGNGNIYVCDYENRRVQILSPQLQYVSQIGPDFAPAEQFSCLSGIAISFDGQTIAIIDESSHIVFILDSDGKLKKRLLTIDSHLSWGAPNFLAFDSNDNLYVSDTTLKCIVQFDGNFEFTKLIGSEGSPHPAEGIMGIAVLEDDIIVVASAGNVIKAYHPDGTHYRDIRVDNYGSDNFLGRGPNGGFIMSDWDYNKIIFYSLDGHKVNYVDVERPVGVGIGLDGKVIVSNWRSCFLYHIEAQS